MSKPKQEKPLSSYKVQNDGADVFVSVGGLRIARRGDPKRRERAHTWTTLQPDWQVWDGPKGIHVQYKDGPVKIL
jgi:hypothetical protein